MSKEKPKKRGFTKYFIDGVPLVEYCKNNGIPYSCIRVRVKDYGLDIKESIDDYLARKSNKYSRCYVCMPNGVSVKEFCEENGYKYTSVMRRKNKYLCSPEKALSQFVGNGGRAYMRIKYTYKGTPVIDLPNGNTIRQRIQRGMPVFIAVEQPIQKKRKKEQ